jgi:hypothetical protein
VASMRARPQLTYRKWQADEARTFIAPSDALFKYRLIWGNPKDAGHAAYNAEIKPGDVILSYQGQWLRVLAYTPIYEQDSPYDGLLQVEPA